MTEDEAKDALFKLHYEYMMHSPKERLSLYEEYKEKRSQIKEALSKMVREKKENELKIK